MKIKSEIKLIDYFKIIFLLLPALVSSIRSFRYFRIIDSNSWQTTDWLINYETGFLRRGLSGTLLNKLSSVFGPLDINMFCLFITLLCIWIISVLFILLSRSSNFLSRLTLCFSPFIYPLFFFWNPQAGGRKEIIGIFFIILVCCGKFLKRQNELKYLLSLGVFLLPSLILMHEALFFLCLPYIIISLIFWIINEKEIRIIDLRKFLIKNYLKFTSVILPSSIVFVVIYLYSFPSSERVSKMCLSLKEVYDDLICTNLPAAFDALAGITNYTAIFSSTYKSPIIYVQWFLCLIYLILFFSNVVAKIILSGSNFYKLNLIKSTSFVCLSISLFIFIMSFPLYAVALDYGR